MKEHSVRGMLLLFVWTCEISNKSELRTGAGRLQFLGFILAVGYLLFRYGVVARRRQPLDFVDRAMLRRFV
jgi:hypothetical protein